MLKIVITGGPCSGKTEIINYLVENLENRGYFVFVCKDTIKELELNGIKKDTYITDRDFQNILLDRQIEKEHFYNTLEYFYPSDKLVILYEKGIMDIGNLIDNVYIFEKMLNERDLTFLKVYENYDCVIHLVTAANGSEKGYLWHSLDSINYDKTIDRTISPKEAIKIDKQILDLWENHKDIVVVDNTNDFKDKKTNVLNEVYKRLGQPLYKNNIRKFLVKKPNKIDLPKLSNYYKKDIIVTYLKNKDIVRVVKQIKTRGVNYSFIYQEYNKDNLQYISSKYITEREYISLLLDADIIKHQIIKEQYCFIWNGLYYELNVYSFCDDYAIIEMELESEISQDNIKFPPLVLIKEITEDLNYNEFNLAKELELKGN